MSGLSPRARHARSSDPVRPVDFAETVYGAKEVDRSIARTYDLLEGLRQKFDRLQDQIHTLSQPENSPLSRLLDRPVPPAKPLRLQANGAVGGDPYRYRSTSPVHRTVDSYCSSSPYSQYQPYRNLPASSRLYYNKRRNYPGLYDNEEDDDHVVPNAIVQEEGDTSTKDDYVSPPNNGVSEGESRSPSPLRKSYGSAAKSEYFLDNPVAHPRKTLPTHLNVKSPRSVSPEKKIPILERIENKIAEVDESSRRWLKISNAVRSGLLVRRANVPSTGDEEEDPFSDANLERDASAFSSIIERRQDRGIASSSGRWQLELGSAAFERSSRLSYAQSSQMNNARGVRDSVPPPVPPKPSVRSSIEGWANTSHMDSRQLSSAAPYEHHFPPDVPAKRSKPLPSVPAAGNTNYARATVTIPPSGAVQYWSDQTDERVPGRQSRESALRSSVSSARASPKPLLNSVSGDTGRVQSLTRVRFADYAQVSRQRSKSIGNDVLQLSPRASM